MYQAVEGMTLIEIYVITVRVVNLCIDFIVRIVNVFVAFGAANYDFT